MFEMCLVDSHAIMYTALLLRVDLRCIPFFV